MEYSRLLRAMDIFQHLPEEELERLASRLHERRVRQGQTVFRRGDPGDAMFVVLDGRVKIVTTDDHGQERVLAFQSEGGFFGEMALLSNDVRSADVQAATDATLLELRRHDFDECVATNPAVLKQLLRALAERQQATNARLMQRDSADDEARSEGRGRVLTLFSTGGGSGKTMLAVNLAVTLAQEYPEQVVLLDLSLTFGHTALVLDVSPRQSLASIPLDVLPDLDREGVNRYLTVHSTTLRLLPGALRPEEGEGVTQEHVQHLIGLLRRHYAYIVIDTAPNFADATLAALEAADRVIVVATPVLTTVRDLLECQRIWNDVVRIPAERLMYVLNHPFGFKALSREEFERGLSRSVDAEVPHGGDAPVQAAMRGEALVVSQPNTAVARAIDKLAHELAGAPTRGAKPIDRGGPKKASGGGPLSFLRGR